MNASEDGGVMTAVVQERRIKYVLLPSLKHIISIIHAIIVL